MKQKMLLAFWFCSCWAVAQESAAEQFRRTSGKILENATPKTDLSGLICAIGQQFLGTSYEGKTLEAEGPEALVVRFQSFDCFTFLESTLALARTFGSGDPEFQTYRQELQRIRYRDGAIGGYPSRLHYTTDWARNNQKKGIITDITQRLGGIPFTKPIHFMTRHREAYRQLASEANFQAMVRVEEQLNQATRHYIPKDQIHPREGQIRDGDIIAITSGIEGLDIAHVGFAFHRQGRLHMLHASLRSKEVEITPTPLSDYLSKQKSHTGIMVFRPLATGL